MKTKLNLNMALRAALLAALTAVLAQLQLPIGPVPFNLAVLGAFLAGMLLRPAWAVCSMCVYMALGVIGIPVFAGFLGGPAVLVGKTGGYVLGYVCIAWCTAMARRFGRWWLTAAGMVLGHNHPSGVALPSAEDRAATLQVRDALATMDIRLLDHIIVADDDFVSMADSGFFRT